MQNFSLKVLKSLGSYTRVFTVFPYRPNILRVFFIIIISFIYNARDRFFAAYSLLTVFCFIEGQTTRKPLWARDSESAVRTDPKILPLGNLNIFIW